MLKEYENIYHGVEEKHWWSFSRRNFIIKIISSIELNEKSKILDVGCSSGIFIDQLSKFTSAEVFGIDVSKNAIDKCQKRGLSKTSVMDGGDLEFRNSTFDLVIASDCLEHIKNDDNALSEWFRVLKNKGQLIIFVPANMSLWSVQDELSKHFRRYQRNEFRLKLKHAGFTINRISFWNIFLFIPIFSLRFLLNLSNTKSNQLNLPSFFINQFIIKLFRIENTILTKINMPIGVSLFAICQKP